MFDLTLTFDNGPTPETTPAVLDVLKRRSIRSTFFVVGEKLAVPGARDLVERAHAEGHWIGNHTFTHSGPLGGRAESDLADREIGRTQEAIGDLAHPHCYFRPQGGGGALGPHLFRRRDIDWLLTAKMTCVLWNAIPGDWKDADGWVARAIEQCRSQPWTLMVLHDLPTGAMRHLDGFLDRVIGMGGHIRQDFPPDCVPICDGLVVRPIDGYITENFRE
jgi:peptidoglycan/xylan/chitin deacetylase (PgdA/CDA1 family)